MSKTQLIASVLILMGVATIAMAGLVPKLLPRDVFWTEQQAQEQAEAAGRLHQTTFEAAEKEENPQTSSVDRIHAQQQREAAQARFDQSKAALARAQFWRETLPRWLRWGGSGVAVIGIFLWLASRNGPG